LVWLDFLLVDLQAGFYRRWSKNALAAYPDLTGKGGFYQARMGRKCNDQLDR
jgi:hypothetical protein